MTKPDDDNHSPKYDLRSIFTLVVVVIIGAIANLIAVITNTKDLLAKIAIDNVGEIEGLLSKSNPPVRIEGSLFLATFIWFITILLLVGVIQYYFESRRFAKIEALMRAEPAPDPQVAKLQTSNAALMLEYEAMVSATDEIIKGLFDLGQPRFRVTRINEVTTVAHDGTTHVERDYEIECGPEVCRNWKFQVFADESADKIKLLSSIDFKAKAIAERDGESLRYLLNRNGSQDKEVTLFFIPPLQPGQTRRFRISYEWPRFAGDLIKRGATIFFATYRTCDPADTAAVTYELRIDKQIGEITCRPRAALQEGSKLVADHTTKAWVWRYEHAAMTIHEGAVELEVKRVEEEPQTA